MYTRFLLPTIFSPIATPIWFFNHTITSAIKQITTFWLNSHSNPHSKLSNDFIQSQILPRPFQNPQRLTMCNSRTDYLHINEWFVFVFVFNVWPIMCRWLLCGKWWELSALQLKTCDMMCVFPWILCVYFVIYLSPVFYAALHCICICVQHLVKGSHYLSARYYQTKYYRSTAPILLKTIYLRHDLVILYMFMPAHCPCPCM